MKLVFICSPYRGDIERNTLRSQAYCRFAYTQGTVPFAPHLHNTQFLDESISEEHQAGIVLGLHLLSHCEELWVFGNQTTEGMRVEIEAARKMDMPIKYFNDKCEELANYETR